MLKLALCCVSGVRVISRSWGVFLSKGNSQDLESFFTDECRAEAFLLERIQPSDGAGKDDPQEDVEGRPTLTKSLNLYPPAL